MLPLAAPGVSPERDLFLIAFLLDRVRVEDSSTSPSPGSGSEMEKSLPPKIFSKNHRHTYGTFSRQILIGEMKIIKYMKVLTKKRFGALKTFIQLVIDLIDVMENINSVITHQFPD